MFFDGKVGSKRTVSLRGNAVKSKEDLLKESQRLREQRELERKKNQQVTKLQRNVRRMMTGCKSSQLAYQSLITKISEWDEVMDTVDSSVTKSYNQDIMKALQQYTFFYHSFVKHEEYAHKQGVESEVTRCRQIREQIMFSLQVSILKNQILIWNGYASSLNCTTASNMTAFNDIRVVRIRKLIKIILHEALDSSSNSEELAFRHMSFLEQLFLHMFKSQDNSCDDVALGLLVVILRDSEFFARQLAILASDTHDESTSLEGHTRCLSMIDRILRHAILMTHISALKIPIQQAIVTSIVNIFSIQDVFSKTPVQPLVRALLQNAPYETWLHVFQAFSIIPSLQQDNSSVLSHVQKDTKKKMDFMVNFAIAFRQGLLSVSSDHSSAEMAALLVRGLHSALCLVDSNFLSLALSLRDRELIGGIGITTSTPMDVEGDEVTSWLPMSDVVTSELYLDYRMADGYKKFDYRIAMLQYGLLSSYSTVRSSPMQTTTTVGGSDFTSFIDLLLRGQSYQGSSHQEDILAKLFYLHFSTDSSVDVTSAAVTGNSSPMDTTTMSSQEFHDLQTRSALISFVTQLLCISPVIVGHKRKSMHEAPLKHSELKSKILKSLAFTHTSSASFVQRLWHFLLQFFGKSMLDLFVTVDERTFLNHNDVMTIATRWGISNHAVYKLLLETIYLLSSVFQYSLSAIDDDELLIEQRVLKKTELIALFMFLKKFMFRFYWIEALCTIGSQFLFPNDEECTLFNLLKHQCLLATTALFHQLCIRSERRNFLNDSNQEEGESSSSSASGASISSPPHVAIQWSVQWTNQEFQLVDSSFSSSSSFLPTNNIKAEELEEENESFALRNPLMKTILTFIPQVIPFHQRVQLLHALIEQDRVKYYDATMSRFFTPPEHIEIRRTHIVDDAIEHLFPMGHKMKGRIQIQFISEQGFAEAGIDGGGLFKEFMDLFAKTVCDPSYGLFIPTTSQQLVPNPASKILGEGHLKLFEFVGRIIGKAMYEKLLFESELSPGFLNILLGRSNQLDDLIHLDNVLYRSLMDMKRRANLGEDISLYGLHFEYSHDVYGKHVTEEIKPHGSTLPVNNQNLREYILLLANYRQNVMIRAQCRAFIKGFRDMIPLDWIRMFHVHELQLVIGGDQRKIDIQDMKRYTGYHGYAENERYIQSFWRIIEEMSIEDQCNLLRFITSCPRQPLLGFGQLQPKLGIQKVNAYEYSNIPRDSAMNTSSQDRQKSAKLPTAATCMNLLKLPYYDSEEVLKEKLLYAIRSKSGFELS